MRRLLCAVLLAGCGAGPCEAEPDRAGWSDVVVVDDVVYDALMADSALSDADCDEVCGGAPDEGELACEDASDDERAAILCRYTLETSEIDCE